MSEPDHTHEWNVDWAALTACSVLGQPRGCVHHECACGAKTGDDHSVVKAAQRIIEQAQEEAE